MDLNVSLFHLGFCTFYIIKYISCSQFSLSLIGQAFSSKVTALINSLCWMYVHPLEEKWINEGPFFVMTWLFGIKATNPEVCCILPWSFTSKNPFMIWPKHDPKQTERLCIDYTSWLRGFPLWHLPGAYATCSDTWQCVAEPCEFTVNSSSDVSEHMQKETGKLTQ